MRTNKLSLATMLIGPATIAFAAAQSGSAQADRGESVRGWIEGPAKSPKTHRSGNNRREESANRHAKAKAAYKSKRAQRKKSKR